MFAHLLFLLVFLADLNASRIIKVELAKRTVSEKPMAVILPTYNNATSTVATLDSIMLQKNTYKNFRIVCIDDASGDGTGDVIEKYIQKNKLKDQMVLIRNQERCRKLKNIYNAIHACRDEEIIVQIDGDDCWAHDHVLFDINAAYTDPNVWLTYSLHRNVPKKMAAIWGRREVDWGEVPVKIIKANAYRSYQWSYGQQRTWYAWLFKAIPIQDLLAINVPGFEEQLYPASNDVAIMMPMLEMAHTRIKFIPDIAYLRNLHSPLVGLKVDKELQQFSGTEIRAKQQYAPLEKPVISQADAIDETTQADIIILANNTGSGLQEKLLESIAGYIEGIGSILVLLGSLHDSEVINIAGLKNKHVVVIPESYVFSDHVDIPACIKLLEQTQAKLFYLDYDFQDHAPRAYQHLINDVYVARITNLEQKQQQAFVCRTQDLFMPDTSQNLHANLSGKFGTGTSTHDVALFFNHTKIRKA